MAGQQPPRVGGADWCREKLEFFSAVVNNVDRESLKQQLEACESEDDAAGLMHSLLWLEDNMQAHQPRHHHHLHAHQPLAHDGRGVDNPFDQRAPAQYVQVLEDFEIHGEPRPLYHDLHQHRNAPQVYPRHIFDVEDHPRHFHDLEDHPQHFHDPEDHPQHFHDPEDHPRHFHGPEDHPQHFHDPEDHSQHFHDPEDHPQHFHDPEDHPRHFHDPEDHPQHFHDPEDHPQHLHDPEDHPQHFHDPEDHPRHFHDPEDHPQHLHDPKDNPQHFYDPEDHSQQFHDHEVFQLVPDPEDLIQHLQDPKEHNLTDAQGLQRLEGPRGLRNTEEAAGLPHDQEIFQIRNFHEQEERCPVPPDEDSDDECGPKLNPQKLDSVEDFHLRDLFADDQSDEDAPELLQQEAEDEDSTTVFHEISQSFCEGHEDETEPSFSDRDESDPYFDADEMPGEEDLLDAEPLVGDTAITRTPGGVKETEEQPSAHGAIAKPRRDMESDERLAKQLSEEINTELREELERDERMARELMEEMEREEQERIERDEQMARRLADAEYGEEDARATDDEPEGAVAAGTNEENINQPAAATNLERDEELARLIEAEEQLLQQPPAEDLVRDEDLARQLEAEAEAEAEDKTTSHLAALVNMFPDADPSYLEERCAGVEEAAAFERVVEALLQCQKTEARMKGHLKAARQARARDTPQPALDPAHYPAQDPDTPQLFECTICFEEEVPMRDVATCNAPYNYHEFCIECIRKHVAALIGQGMSSFRCMNGYCEAEFAERTLRRVMQPVVYEKVQERRQQEEVMAAGLENLVSCPFCCFMIIMPDPEDKVLECLNPECLKESCRLCKEPSHIPLRCEEVERDSQKDARILIENQMAEAMIRQCPKCGKRFVTEGGCNKMTCSCGTVMCYLCKQIITNSYQHFEQREVASNKCPLWSNATQLHSTEVREAATRARQEIDPALTLVHDPTRDLN